MDDKQVAISQEKIQLLIKLGVLDENLDVTPEAYTGYVTRMPVNEQAEALGLPLIFIPHTKKNEEPEKRTARFLESCGVAHVSGGFEESYLVRSFISSILPCFDTSKRNQKIKPELFKQEVSVLGDLTEAQVVRRLEENNVIFSPHFGFVYQIRMPKELPQVPITPESLVERYHAAECELLEHAPISDRDKCKNECIKQIKSKAYAKHYANSILTYLWLWRTVEPAKWVALIRTAYEHWDKMYSGWPDINVIDPVSGLTMIEVKGKDKLHTSQVFTLLKLREILGPQRVAIAWVNNIARDTFFHDNITHKEKVGRWLKTPAPERDNDMGHPESFYSGKRNLVI